MTGKVGVAISTTGTRPEMLERAEEAWRSVGMDLVSTVYDLDRVGVAAAKNRGLVNLMDAGVEHLFLADDDMHPLQRFSWTRYVDDPALHLSLSWGFRRARGEVVAPLGTYSAWEWPRGVLLYVHRSVIERVGGMRTEYGSGGHEHVDFSRRIHQAGLGPSPTEPFCDLVQDPYEWFHCEDWQREGETVTQLQARRRRITTVKRTAADRKRIDRLWRELDGDTSYVEYR